MASGHESFVAVAAVALRHAQQGDTRRISPFAAVAARTRCIAWATCHCQSRCLRACLAEPLSSSHTPCLRGGEPSRAVTHTLSKLWSFADLICRGVPAPHLLAPLGPPFLTRS